MASPEWAALLFHKVRRSATPAGTLHAWQPLHCRLCGCLLPILKQVQPDAQQWQCAPRPPFVTALGRPKPGAPNCALLVGPRPHSPKFSAPECCPPLPSPPTTPLQDFKRHLDAVDLLLANLADLLPEVQASLDLLLRWAVLRICDGNMQVRLGGAGRGGW